MAEGKDRDREQARGADAQADGVTGNRTADPASEDATVDATAAGESRPGLRAGAHGQTGDDAKDSDDNVNPPRTTTGRMTAPKFGSAGSGGAELEPGPGV